MLNVSRHNSWGVDVEDHGHGVSVVARLLLSGAIEYRVMSGHRCVRVTHDRHAATLRACDMSARRIRKSWRH